MTPPLLVLWHSLLFYNYSQSNHAGGKVMTILFKYSMSFASAVVAGKFIFVQHVFVKYNRIMHHALENSPEAFSLAFDSSSFLLF